jgi:hypothetical protein
MSFMLLIFKNESRSFLSRCKTCHYVAFYQEFVDKPVNGPLSLFRIDSIHQMEISLSHVLLVLSLWNLLNYITELETRPGFVWVQC